MKKNLFFISVFLTQILYSQNATIEGTISDEGNPLAFATVMIPSQNKGTTSNEDGTFKISDLLPGTYTITASFVGYKPLRTKVTVVSEQTNTIDLNLSSSIQLEEIVVTGTMKPTYVTASPIKVDVITSQQLDTYIPAAASSVIEGVQLVNGVEEVIACGVCYTNSISINGLNGAYTSVLMDGTPMFGNLASVYGLNGIPNMIIDRFEVIKGPSSTLYGSEAVAGVINIITKDPKQQPLFSVDLMGTTHKESFGNIAFAPQIKKSNGYIGFNYAYVNDFDDYNEDHFGDAILLDRYSFFTKWNIHRKSGKDFNISGKYYYEDRRNGVEEFVDKRNYRTLRGDDQIYGESIYTKRAELFGSYVFNTSFDLKLDFSLSHHDQDSYYGSDFYKAKQQIVYANFIWNVGYNKHDIIIGATTRFNAYDDNTIATEGLDNNGSMVNTPDNRFIPGLFVQDEITVSDQWTVLAGARLDHFDDHGIIFSPRLNFKITPSDWTTIRSNFGTGFRTVNLFTEDHAFISGQRSVQITEALEPEQSYNTSLSITNVVAVLGGSGTIDVEGYFTHFTNKIIPDYSTPGKIIYENSEGFARTMGIGVSLTQQFQFPLALNAAINFQSAKETEPDENGVMLKRDIEFAPRWSSTISANYRIKKAGMTFAYTTQITGPMALPEVFDIDENGLPYTAPRPTTSEIFSLHNFQITKRINDIWTVYGGVQNLTNFRQNTSPLVGYNDPNAPIGFSDFFDTSYAYAPNHGREFYLGFKWDLKRRIQ